MHALLPPHPSVPYKHAAMQCPTNRLHTFFCFMRGNLSNGIFANIGYSVFQSGTAVTGVLVVMSDSSVAIFVNAIICSDAYHLLKASGPQHNVSDTNRSHPLYEQ